MDEDFYATDRCGCGGLVLHAVGAVVSKVKKKQKNNSSAIFSAENNLSTLGMINQYLERETIFLPPMTGITTNMLGEMGGGRGMRGAAAGCQFPSSALYDMKLLTRGRIHRLSLSFLALSVSVFWLMLVFFRRKQNRTLLVYKGVHVGMDLLSGISCMRERETNERCAYKVYSCSQSGTGQFVAVERKEILGRRRRSLRRAC